MQKDQLKFFFFMGMLFSCHNVISIAVLSQIQTMCFHSSNWCLLVGVSVYLGYSGPVYLFSRLFLGALGRRTAKEDPGEHCSLTTPPRPHHVHNTIVQRYNIVYTAFGYHCLKADKAALIHIINYRHFTHIIDSHHYARQLLSPSFIQFCTYCRT